MRISVVVQATPPGEQMLQARTWCIDIFVYSFRCHLVWNIPPLSQFTHLY